jgi:iron complex transport system permease protein
MTAHKKIQDLAENLGYEYTDEYSDQKKIRIILSILGLIIITGALTLILGAYSISLESVWKIIFIHLSMGDLSSIPKLHQTIIWDIRLPRIILAITVGGALAIAGAVFQSTFRNPLVEPYILGVSSGAAFGAALGIVFHSIFFSVQISAFIFAILAVVSTYSLARIRGQTPLLTLILAGVIVGAIFSALVSLLNYLADDNQLREIIFWLMGGFYYTSWADVILLTPVVFLCFFLIWSRAWNLNVLSMGDEEAQTLGVNPERNKAVMILLATAITALSVSLVGIVAWVGLMMPHASRMILGPDNRFVIPACFCMGALYLLVCDTLARTITVNEVPIGIITSLLGAPYLCYLIRSKGKTFLG